ncbi:hypothetical protein Fmac_008477 [Flemingia macrophylla]|uniref:Uncharacterized protein n=1 Tax=Flemingia macrophylla TaxID=520843 RepID=A0ABD1MXH6_9FABA
MGNRKGWRYFQRLSIYPFKSILRKVTSNFKFKSEGRRNRLLSLYKDMESCGEYADIQIMWKIIQSSSPHYACHKKRVSRTSHWVVCFRLT